MRKTEVASVWKVAWAGGLVWEGPTCHNERATSWRAAYGVDRSIEYKYIVS